MIHPTYSSFSCRRETLRAGAARPLFAHCRWTILGLLVGLMLIDHFDRQVVVSMFSHIKTDWALTDVQLGALVSIVSITVAAGTIPLSFMADRWGHVQSIFAMAVLWSIATLACALAPGYTSLLVARSGVGLAEAAYGSVGAALLTAIFPARSRSTVLGLFLAGSLMGSVLGVGAGGAMAQAWGWQGAFGVAAIPGLVLAGLFLIATLQCRKRSGTPEVAVGRERITVAGSAMAMRRTPTVALASLGGALQLLCLSAVYAWLPTHLARDYGLAPDGAGMWTAAIVLIGIIGTFAWSRLADVLGTSFAHARLLVPAAASIVTGASLVTAFGVLPPGIAQLGCIVIGGVAMAGTIGPVAAVVMDVVHPSLRATAASVLALAQNLLGLAAGPFVAGVLSDRYGLSVALGIVPLSCFAAALMFVLASRRYVDDAERAARNYPQESNAFMRLAA